MFVEFSVNRARSAFIERVWAEALLGDKRENLDLKMKAQKSGRESGSENESTVPCFTMDSNRTDNGAVNGIIIEDNEAIKPFLLKEFPLYGLCCCRRHRLPFWAVGSLICNAIGIIAIAVLSGVLISEKGRETQVYSPTAPVYSCPEGWIGYRRRCYYFAKVEGDWESGRKNCSAFNASLAVIDSQEEMDFLRRYKTPADYWIGLQRNEKTDPWRWINNTIFNNIFPIRGRGECAYLNHEGIASSSCGREEPWICSRPPVGHQIGVMCHMSSARVGKWKESGIVRASQ